MIYKDPFIGDIELTKVGETSRHMVGESVVDTLYEDTKGNVYIDTWSTIGDFSMEEKRMVLLRKALIEEIVKIYG